MEIWVVLHDDFDRGPLQDYFIGAFETRDGAIAAVREIADGYQTDISGNSPDFIYVSWDAGAATIEKRRTI